MHGPFYILKKSFVYLANYECHYSASLIRLLVAGNIQIKHVQVTHCAFCAAFCATARTLVISYCVYKRKRDVIQSMLPAADCKASTRYFIADLSLVNPLHTTLQKYHIVFPIACLLMCSLHEATHVKA